MPVLLNSIQDKVLLSPEQLSLLEKVIEHGMAGYHQENTEVSVVLADDDYLQELNLEYRGLDSPTDVLSFAFQEDNGGMPIHFEENIPELLGDIYISVERAVEQAKAYDHTLERELCYLAVHGLLHLLGYDHQDPEQTAKMRESEELIMTEFDLGRTTP